MKDSTLPSILQNLFELLEAAGRVHQWLLAVVDGSFERAVEFWQGLPERTVLLGRTAHHPIATPTEILTN